jgi:serine/threonine protein phosphatase 1
MGGNATLASYGVPGASWARPAATRAAFAAAFPPEHMAFLDACELMIPLGGYLFVHAGIRPGVPLAAQTREDLIWIREPFLGWEGDFGAKVVHGHTIVPAVEHRPNRIALDTGAVRTGVLSTVVLEGDRVALLTEAGPKPWPEGSGLPGWRNLWMRR